MRVGVALVVVGSGAYLTPESAKNPEDHSDDSKDSTKRVEDSDVEQSTQYQQYHSEKDHRFPFWITDTEDIPAVGPLETEDPGGEG